MSTKTLNAAGRRWGGNRWAGVTDADRFWARVEKTDGGCWRWVGPTIWNGYGLFFIKGKKTPAHRFSYELLVGPIPDGLHIDHLCRNRGCVNPAHLEPVTPRENNRRGLVARGLRKEPVE